jgi:hypothetical protein
MKRLLDLMPESNLEEGNQKIPADTAEMRYGVSVMDECLGWHATEQLLRDAYARMCNPLATVASLVCGDQQVDFAFEHIEYFVVGKLAEQFGAAFEIDEIWRAP